MAWLEKLTRDDEQLKRLFTRMEVLSRIAEGSIEERFIAPAIPLLAAARDRSNNTMCVTWAPPAADCRRAKKEPAAEVSGEISPPAPVFCTMAGRGRRGTSIPLGQVRSNIRTLFVLQPEREASSSFGSGARACSTG